jgi:indolepyruvate ferredoxin oxidoreductase beta subunit
MQLADGRADTADLVRLVQRFSREHQLFDMNALAADCGTVVSAVLLGAIAGSGLLPFDRRFYEEAVCGGRTPDKAGVSAQASLRGFARAWEIVRQRQAQTAYVAQVLGEEALGSRLRGNDDKEQTVIRAQAGMQSVPDSVREFATLGHARLLEYQDRRYADLYLERLGRVLAAERAADPSGTHGFAASREMARWLALWMAFDDIVRVADLKSRASRWQRVQREVKADDADLLKVYDHFKPGVPEFAALLPPSLAQRLLAWDRRRAAAGREPWALPLKVGTHTVGGMLALRVLAGLKALRVRGSRYANEQQMIDKWLAGVVQGLGRGWSLGHEIALCGRLIKGYGATNERGKETLLHVLDHLAAGADPQAAAQAIAAARAAALADDAGRALDATLAQLGAPPRPLKPQPIRFVRKPRPQGETTVEARRETVI